MNSIVDSSTSFASLSTAAQGCPSTIVLQPNGELNHLSSYNFQRSLEEALELATENVIVDLLWIKTTDQQGIAALVAGIAKAAYLGKAISFQSMDIRIRLEMESEWDRQRDIQFGGWNDVFESNLESFLAKPTSRGLALRNKN